MDADTTPSFKSLFDSVYRAARAGTLNSLPLSIQAGYGGKSTHFAESLRKSPILEASIAGTLAHLDYEHLQIGDTEKGAVAVFFMDIRGFTKRVLALDPHTSVTMLQATLQAAIMAVLQNQGCVHDLTGDGIMAIFGGRNTNASVDAMRSLRTASYLMKGMKDVVSAYLIDRGLDEIKIAVGIEYGTVLWTRLGVPDASQVKPIGGASFLAGKLCSGGYTSAWECKIGEDLAALISSDHETYVTECEPFDYSYSGQEFRHRIFLFNWEAYWEAFGHAHDIGAVTLSESANTNRRITSALPMSDMEVSSKSLTLEELQKRVHGDHGTSNGNISASRKDRMLQKADQLARGAVFISPTGTVLAGQPNGRRVVSSPEHKFYGHKE